MITGLVIAVVGGMMIEKLQREKHVESFIKNASAVDKVLKSNEVVEILKKARG